MFDLLFPKHWSTLKKLIWLFRNLASAVEKTVSAAIVHIRDALAAPAQQVTVAIEPVQDLHGYDSPWPAGGGKNLLENRAVSSEASGITFTVNTDGTVSINGTATANAVLYLNRKTNWLSPDTKYRLSGSDSASTISGYRLQININNATAAMSAGGGDIEFTTPSTVNSVDVYIVVLAGITVSNAIFKPMIRLAAVSDSAFAPYSNICPITGWTGVNVYRTGKNLWNKNGYNVFNGYYGTQQSGKWPLVANSAHTITWIPCKPNTTYTASRLRTVANERFFISYSDEVPSAGSFVYGAKQITNYSENIGELLKVTITTGANAKYLVLWAWWSSSVNPQDTLQIEEGSTATAYSSYTGTVHPISWQSEAGTVYGGSLDVTNGLLTVDRAIVDLGTRDWTRNTAGTFPYFNSAYFDEAGRPASISLQCSAYKAIANMNGTSFRASNHNGEICIDRQSARPAIMVQDSAYSDAAAFKAAMSGVQLVYELATPQTYQLTPTEIELLLGENNIWADTGDLSLTYLADGRASEVEALNILLAGRYVNTGAADEATDEEALNILLGR